MLLPNRMPEVEIPELHDLQEVHTMLAERVKEWTHQWREQGLHEGRVEGRAELVIELIESRLGRLEESQRRRVRDLDKDTLVKWAQRAATAQCWEDLAGD